MQIVASAEASSGAYITSATTNSGTAVYKLDIKTAGKYKIVANVYASDGGSDSFFVKIDNGVEDIWDIFKGDSAEYNKWSQDEVALRGTGTFATPQYDPFSPLLTEGSHTLTFRGRDPNARLDYFYLIKVPERTALIEAENGVLTTPMQIISSSEASGGAYIASATGNQGTAVYNFNIEVAGLYKIIADVYAADSASDSFFVKIDNGVEDIWDIFQGNSAEYGAWGQDEVAYRGAETFDRPQNDPYAVQLAPGPHTVSFRGRDSNSRLDAFYLIKIYYEPRITRIKFMPTP
jgi:hypothetical protein